MAAIASRGYWLDESTVHHAFDDPLAAELAILFRSKSVVDLGCGPGSYVSWLRREGIDCDGYDGNPNTAVLSGGQCMVLDLSAPVQLDRTYDWALSLEVGEHIPRQYESAFLDNIARHAREGAVLSWGLPGQEGWGHVNLRTNRYIQSCMRSRGFVHEDLLANFLRNKCSLHWFRGTLMVFRRHSAIVSQPATAENSARESTRSVSEPNDDDAPADALAEMLGQIKESVRATYWLCLMQRIRDIVEQTIPLGSVVLVVGHADDDLMRLPGRHSQPFPQNPDGSYSKRYVLRGADVLAELSRLGNDGARFILFPATSLWFLEHYQELRDYLDDQCRAVFSAECCKIFELPKP